MSFLNMHAFGVLAGLAGLAGVLFILQQLRVRHAVIPVPTTLFWAAAAREAPVRIFRRSFRHWLAYLLVVLICGLLWIGFAGPRIDPDGSNGHTVLLLDGSAHTSDPAEFERAKRQLVDDVADLPANAREVLFSGAYTLRLLAPGENRLALEKRLESLAPEAAPSGLDEQLRLMTRNGAYPETVHVAIYGRAPVRERTLAELPAGFSVSRAVEYAPADVNHGISALGVAPAASGVWDRVDIRIGVTSTPGSSIDAGDLSFDLEGSDAGGAVPVRVAEGRFALRDIPASGTTLRVRIDKDDKLSLDNVAHVTLPERTRIRVAVADGISLSVRHAIRADKGLELVTDGADVMVRMPGDTPASDLPAFVLRPMQAQEAAFEIAYAGERQAERVLEDSLVRLGLDQIDGPALAAAAGRPIGVTVFGAAERRISIWSELLQPDYNFIHSRSFPLFLSQSLRWLAGEETWYAYLAAGRPAAEQDVRSSLAPADDGSLEVFGAAYVPARAGAVTSSGGTDLQIALLSDDVSGLSSGADLDAVPAGSAKRVSSSGIVIWLVIAILLLLGTEWYLYQRGLMP